MSEPVIVVDGTSFWTWEEYTRSQTYAPKPRHCGTVPSGVDVAVAAVAEGTQDCTFSLTNPDPAYDPSVERYRVPIVVHVIRSTDGIFGYVSPETVHDQIDVINEDFLAMAGTHGANGTDVQIEFYLATRDPLGNPTSGITYSDNTAWFNDNVAYWETLAWDTNRYVNMYTNSAHGFTGYVPDLPQGGIVGTTQDRIVIRWTALGRNAPIGPPMDQGRTATHELGHYLGLYHTFSFECTSPTDCYTTGDLICDTNPQDTMTLCSDANSCGSPDPVHNHMNSGGHLCKWEYTLEQARRMRCTLLNYRPDLFEATGGAVCGDNIRETIEECDGTDDAVCPGACLGNCQCQISGVMCGNNIREAIEECDGTDDAPCPGTCLGNCQCAVPCQSAAEPLPDPAAPDAGFGTRNRILSFEPQNPAMLTALRVTGPGWQAWVGEPVEVSENSGTVHPAGAPGFPTIRVAPLQCVPWFKDWTTEGIVQVYDQSFVPGGVFTVEAVHGFCDFAQQSFYSPPLDIQLSAWGDVVGPYDNSASRWASPDGSVSVPLDVVAILDKFQNLSSAPTKTRTDIAPDALDWIIDIFDITYTLDAFLGSPYPFETGAPPCP